MFEQYKVSTAADGKVCSKCADISNQVFYIKDRTPGVNFPPMHPWCRCTFEIYVEDWDKWQDDYVKRHSKNPDKILQSFRQNANMINNGSKPFNHPDCGMLSPADLKIFCDEQSMNVLEALANNAHNTSIIIKTADSDVDGYREFVVKETNKYKNSLDEKYIDSHVDELFKFAEKLLNAGNRYGFKIIKK